MKQKVAHMSVEKIIAAIIAIAAIAAFTVVSGDRYSDQRQQQTQHQKAEIEKLVSIGKQQLK